MNVAINRQLLGLEDLAFGVGTVTQTRGGVSGNVTLINASNLPFDASFTLQQVLDTNYASIATVGADLINIDLVATNLTSINSAAAIAGDLATAITAVAITNADVVLTHADVVLTHADVVLTNADAASTALDKIATNADVVLTNADAASTALDKIATNADAASTALDKIATNADVVLTNADVVLTHADALAAQVAEISWVPGGWTTATVYTSTTPRQGTSHNGASYICILSHTSGALTEPLIGANWATYWEVLAEKGIDGTGTIASVVAGTNVTVDATDPANPIINVAAIGSEHYDQEAEPIAGSTGATWYVPSTGVLYKYVNDGVSDIWIDISTAGVEEAPIDGFTYARQNSSWVYTQEVFQTTQPTISIATSVNEGSNTVGTITNYDADATYYISAINGTIAYTTGSTFTYTSVDITNGVNTSDTISVYATKAGEVQSLTTEQAMTIVYVPVVADTTIQVVDFTGEAQINDGWSLI